MKPPLVALPVELVEHVATFLEAHDLSSLRLTCRELEQKASRGCFESLFRRRRVELTTQGLGRLVAATRRVPRARLLQDCLLVGLLPLRPAVSTWDTWAFVEHGEELAVLADLLTEAFRNLRRLSPGSAGGGGGGGGGGLLTLRLELAVPDTITEAFDIAEVGSWYVGKGWGPSCNHVWDAAVRTFTIAMEALEGSLLPVQEHLDVFGGAGGYALACDAFVDRLDRDVPWPKIFGSLKRMTLSLSVPHTDKGMVAGGPHPQHSNTTTTDPGNASEKALQQRDYSQYVLRRVLQLSNEWTRLESLDLLWYNIGYMPPGPSPTAAIEDTREDDAGPTAPRVLKECRLRGLYMTESDVLEFLDKVLPSRLTFADINLLRGTWAPALARLAGPPEGSTTTKTYHLEDLSQDAGLVQFEIRGRAAEKEDAPGAMPGGGELGGEHFEPSAVYRQEAEEEVGGSGARQPLAYRLLRDKRGLQEDHRAWRKKKILAYGFYGLPWIFERQD